LVLLQKFLLIRHNHFGTLRITNVCLPVIGKHIYSVKNYCQLMILTKISRLRPDTTAEEIVNTPVRLTPRGGIIKLSPLKNLLSAEHSQQIRSPLQSIPPDPADHNTSFERLEGDVGGAEGESPRCRDPDLHGPEVIMSLSGVCRTGQQMKFTIPGMPQPFTLNFSAEALQVLVTVSVSWIHD
jgi:hypothetical protein